MILLFNGCSFNKKERDNPYDPGGKNFQYFYKVAENWGNFQRGAWVTAMGWNGKYWLIAVEGVIDAMDNVKPYLYKYDGNNFEDITSKLIGLVGWNYTIDAIEWNGNYWLIGGYGGLNKYDGTNVTNLTGNLIGISYVKSIGWNGNYWLIGGGGPGLNKYDGNIFTDLKNNLIDFDGEIRSVCWNGFFWLIGGSDSTFSGLPTLNKYDGISFVNLRNKLSSLVSSPWIISYIRYNNNYWLIGGNDVILKSVDGENFEKIDIPIYIMDVKWNGYYWLLGGSGPTLMRNTLY